MNGVVDVSQIYSTRYAFATLLSDGWVATWGDSSWGGNSSIVANLIDGSNDVVQIFSTGSAFAALRADGSVVAWGYSGGDSSSVGTLINSDVVSFANIETNDSYKAVTNIEPTGTVTINDTTPQVG